MEARLSFLFEPPASRSLLIHTCQKLPELVFWSEIPSWPSKMPSNPPLFYIPRGVQRTAAQKEEKARKRFGVDRVRAVDHRPRHAVYMHLDYKPYRASGEDYDTRSHRSDEPSYALFETPQHDEQMDELGPQRSDVNPTAQPPSRSRSDGFVPEEVDDHSLRGGWETLRNTDPEAYRRAKKTAKSAKDGANASTSCGDDPRVDHHSATHNPDPPFESNLAPEFAKRNRGREIHGGNSRHGGSSHRRSH